MKNYILVFLIFQCFFGWSQGSINDSKKTSKQLIKEVKKSKAYLIDVRTPEEFNAGHLRYSQNIDFKSADFKANIGKLDKSKTIYLYCRSGNRSGKSVDTLISIGFAKAINIGGFANLTIAGLPID